MNQKSLTLNFEAYSDARDLSPNDLELLQKARGACSNAYAPYSNFYVGASAHLTNGEIITGSNQENASFPAGICAERVLLSAISAVAPNEGIQTMAISYNSDHLDSNKPIAPCGVCRQAMIEYQSRFHIPMRIILSGQEGEVFIFQSISELLPLSFTSQDLGKH